MQSVSAAWTAEEKDTVQNIVQNFRVSWKKSSIISNRTFTIGVSTIGGNDFIGINPGAIGSPGNYQYFDESSYVKSLGWERGYNMPTGGLVKTLGEATLENTTGRFTPGYMGGHSELFTAILPRRPVIFGTGFNFSGIDQTIPQFSGIFTKNPQVDSRNKQVSLQMADYIDFFSNKFVDTSLVFTAETTDTVIESLFSQLGMSTAQYRLDPGINVIPFGAIDAGAKFSDVIQKLVESENGHLYQREDGVFIFQNRQHWDSVPYTQVQRVITTAQVIQAQAPTEDHIINVVEIKSNVRSKAIFQKLWSLSAATLVPPNGSVEIFADFSDDAGGMPVLSVTAPSYAASPATTSYYATNTLPDGTGSVNNAAISMSGHSQFTTSFKMVFQNSSSSPTYITALELWGRPAKVTSSVYVKQKRGLSVTAFEERPISIANEFIQSQDWAQSLANVLLEDFSRIENLQDITIMAIPELQLGDLISWQGRYWRVYDIKSVLDPTMGYTQELKLLQRTIRSYFRIGISTIGGSDKIAP